tara:strand:- start:206 stop:1477 length:1272 start_codon:yes stop_codon:yes gene_type:complete
MPAFFFTVLYLESVRVPVNIKQTYLSVAFLLGASIITFLLYSNRPETVQIEVKLKPVAVDIQIVQKATVRISVSAQGTVQPSTQTKLVSEVSGKIIFVAESFNAGGVFKTGELLLQIDDRDYLARLEQMKARVASAKSNLAQEKGKAEVARQDWLKFGGNRIKRSQESTDLYLRKPQLAKSQAELDSSLANLQKARDDLDRTSIRAPYNGIVREKLSDIGQYVSTGQLLATTFAIDYAEVRLAIPQNKLGHLDLPRPGARTTETAEVELYATIGGSLYNWPAQLNRTEGVIDERSRVLFTVARINDPYGFKNLVDMPLRIGTFVTAKIAGKLINDIVVLPRHVLRAGNFLWVVDENNTLRNRQVETLQSQDSNIYVTSGLKNGERVCISIVGSVMPGTLVTITPKHNIAKIPRVNITLTQPAL